MINFKMHPFVNNIYSSLTTQFSVKNISKNLARTSSMCFPLKIIRVRWVIFTSGSYGKLLSINMPLRMLGQNKQYKC